MVNATADQSRGELISCEVTPAFQNWMAVAGGTLAISTYQAGKVALVGWSGSGVSLLLRNFDTPMGLAVEGDLMAVATREQIVQFANSRVLAPHFPQHNSSLHDALYLPRSVHLTGNQRVHDIAFSKNGIWFVNTLFSCLATVSPGYSFLPRWKPPFISELSPEDRCHLNGFAMSEGKPRFVTALGATDLGQGWREQRATGGVLMDVESGQIVLRGLAMPHSPRMHGEKLWFLNSGAGELCVADPAAGTFSTVCALPGFLRGLSFAASYAVVGMGKIREKHLFSGMPVQDRFPRLLCGVGVVDLRSGSHVATLEFTSGCHELYDVQFIPGVTRPMIRTTQDRDAHEPVTLPDSGFFIPSGA